MNTYKVVTGTNNIDIEKKVNQAIAGGFAPQGGISILQRGSSEIFVQAVVMNKPQGVRK